LTLLHCILHAPVHLQRSYECCQLLFEAQLLTIVIDVCMSVRKHQQLLILSLP